MKIKRIRKKILEISEAHFLLRDKLAAMSLSSNTEDEIHRIVRQPFTGSIIKPIGPQNSENLFCSSAEGQGFKEDTSKVIDTDFSTLLELPTFPLLKNSETQVSITPKRYASLNRNGKGTIADSQIENSTTSSAISHKRNHRVSFKNNTQTTSNRVESNKTKLGPTGDCKLNQVSSPLGGKKIDHMTRGKRAENTAERPVNGIEKKSEKKFGLEAEMPQYRVLITSASRKLILPEPCITPSSSTKVLPEKESVPKQIMLEDKENRVSQCFGTRLKTAMISRELPNLSSHTTLKTSLGQYSSPSFSCSTVPQLNCVESNKNQNFPFLTLSSQYFGGPIETADCTLSVPYQECRKSILVPQTLNLIDTRSATKREETGKKCDGPDSPLRGYESIPLMESTVKMQHFVDDKKMRENETNVIKCSAQLFQGPIDNADFVINIIHPTDLYENTVPQTIINYSKGQIILSVEARRKNDEYCTSKDEEIVIYPEGFVATQNTTTEKKSQIPAFIPENILNNSGKGDASLLTWEKSTLSDLTIIESAHTPNGNLEIKEDALKISNSRKTSNSEYLLFQESIFATSFDHDIKTQEDQSIPLKRSLFPQEGENEIEESKVLKACAAAESFEILNSSTTFSYELKKMCNKEELCPKMDNLCILQRNDEFRQKVDQFEKTEQRLHESLEPSNISLSQFQDSSAFFKMHTVSGMPPTRTIHSKTSRDCSPSSQSQQFSPSNEILTCETVDGSYNNCTEARYSPTSTYVGTAVAESTVGSELRPIELPPEIFNSRSRRLLRLNG